MLISFLSIKLSSTPGTTWHPYVLAYTGHGFQRKQASRESRACLAVSAVYVRAVISTSNVCLRRTKLKCITGHFHDPSARSNAVQHIFTLSCIHFHKTIVLSTAHLFPKPSLSSFIVSALAFPHSASRTPVGCKYAIAYIIPPS